MSATSHPLAAQAARTLRLHAQIVPLQTAALCNAESLRAPQDGGNCLNWVLGHLLVHREPLPPAAMLADFAASTAALIDRLPQVEPAMLDEIPVGEKRSRGDRLGFALFHETYHVGQLELLRHVAGRHDKII